MSNFMKLSFFPTLMSLVFAGACTKSAPEVSAVSAQEAYGMLRNDFAVLVDVRTPEEIANTGLAQGAVSIPLSKIESNAPEWKEFVSNTSKDKQVIFYCASGGRAGKAAETLSKEGFRTGNMGGFEEWKSAGLPVAQPAQ